MTEPETDRSSLISEAGHRPRALIARIALALFGLILFAGFISLGTWQIYRLQWKEDLIARVEARIHSAPVDIPESSRWPDISAANSEYRHVQASGVFLHDLTAKVQASTKLGSGYWVMTPLRTVDGGIVLVNRGFIPQGTGLNTLSLHSHGNQHVTVTGLLRMSEPNGGFLRDNEPSRDRWYSRDVVAIAAARGLPKVAPYFIDADAYPAGADGKTGFPIGGLTVVNFPNNHLVYALTWYALAVMTAGAAIWVAREERRNRHSSTMQIPVLSTGK